MKIEFWFPKELPDTILTEKTEDGRPVWMLQKDYHFTLNLRGLTIPAGFEFDYASVPRGLWNTFPPIEAKHCRASLVHDWFYAGEYFPRAFNDDVFLGIMAFYGVPQWKRNLMYAAVRIGGNFSYKRHTIKSVMNVRELSGITDTQRPLYREINHVPELLLP